MQQTRRGNTGTVRTRRRRPLRVAVVPIRPTTPAPSRRLQKVRTPRDEPATLPPVRPPGARLRRTLRHATPRRIASWMRPRGALAVGASVSSAAWLGSRPTAPESIRGLPAVAHPSCGSADHRTPTPSAPPNRTTHQERVVRAWQTSPPRSNRLCHPPTTNPPPGPPPNRDDIMNTPILARTARCGLNTVWSEYQVV